MNLLTRRSTAVTFSDLPSRPRRISDRELEEIMGRGCDNEGEECSPGSCCCSKNIFCQDNVCKSL